MTLMILWEFMFCNHATIKSVIVRLMKGLQKHLPGNSKYHKHVVHAVNYGIPRDNFNKWDNRLPQPEPSLPTIVIT